MTEFTTTPSVADLCRDYGWRLEGAPDQTASGMTVMYCPVTRQDGVHAISLLHAFGGIVATRAGAQVKYAMESPVVENGWRQPMERWFQQAEVPVPTFTALEGPQISDTDPRTEAYPTTSWGIVQRFSQALRNAPDVRYFASALKITPPGESQPEDSSVFAGRFEESGGRLDTAYLITSGLHKILRTAKPSSVATLSGLDERPFWQLWDQIFCPGTDGPAHLYFPTVMTKPPDQPLNWYCTEDLVRAFKISMPTTDFDKPNAYIPWLTRQVYMLGKTIFNTWDETDPREWGGVVSTITDPYVQRHVATVISAFLLQLPAIPYGQRPPRQA